MGNVFLSAKEVAKMLGIDVRTFRKQAVEGFWPPACGGGPRTRRWVVAQFIDSNGLPVAPVSRKDNKGQ